MTTLQAQAGSFVRVIPDWPKKGVMFQDITPVLKVGKLYREIIQEMAKQADFLKVDKVVAAEARGFLFGAPIAVALGAGLVIVRKAGKLPAATEFVEATLEYGTEELEIHSDSLDLGDRVLVVDDVLATGGTATAMMTLVNNMGAHVEGFQFFIELAALRGRLHLMSLPVMSFLTVM